jgi:hypothetical protein
MKGYVSSKLQWKERDLGSYLESRRSKINPYRFHKA